MNHSGHRGLAGATPRRICPVGVLPPGVPRLALPGQPRRSITSPTLLGNAQASRFLGMAQHSTEASAFAMSLYLPGVCSPLGGVN